ncbi:MAG: sulfite exporter TauE/SafE family protein [Chitinophagaceae bacterium]|nr:sulfite exporter TauE/SafE family protein [Chitinophagaceae bacterium]
MNPDLLIALCLLIVAFLYASVGHGGASGYIAIMSIFNISVDTYKPLVLILNIFIAGIAFVQFYRAGYFKWSMCWPFLITSIPFAFLGSKMAVHSDVYNLLLGIALIFPVIRLLGFNPKEKKEIRSMPVVWALLIGAFIGFIAGLLNIGGGIFLSPVLILMAWANAKEAAAISSLFIVCNSLSGLVASTNLQFSFNTTFYLWLAAAMAGGIVGSWFGSRNFKLITVQYILASVLSIACVKLIFLM